MPSTPIIDHDCLNDYTAFSDESHTDGNNAHMVIGGILCRSADAHLIGKRFTDIHDKYPFKESIQWKNVSKAKLDLYKEVVDEIFLLNPERIIDFACICFDKSKIDHATHNKNDPETGFFKFLFQHHYSYIKRYKKQSTMRVFHGNMDTRYDLAELRRCLNFKIPTDNLEFYFPWKQVEFKKVRETRCLQIADLLIGAVAYMTNETYKIRPDSPKTELANYIQSECPIHRLDQPTNYPNHGFNIWHFRL